MAFAYIATSGIAGTSKTAGTSVPVTYTTGSFAAGTLMVAAIASDNLGSGSDGDKSDVASVSDNAGNTFLKAAEFSNVQAGAAAGATVSIWYCVLANAVTSANIVTANFNGSPVAKLIFLGAYTKSAGTTINVTSPIVTLANDNADPGSMALSGLTSREYLFLRFTAGEANPAATFTPTSGWSADFNTWTTGGGGATNQYILGERLISTATGATSDPTYAAGVADLASVMFAFYETTTRVPRPTSVGHPFII